MKLYFQQIRKKIKLSGGFSLIEIMVASVIASLIFLMVATAYRSVIKAIKDLTGYAEFYENVNLALLRIDRDFTNIYRASDNKLVNFIGTLDDGRGSVNFITVDYSDFMVNGNIRRPCPVSDIREVGYHLVEDGEIPGIYRLVRREQSPYDEDVEHGGTKSVILENVLSVRFQYAQGNDYAEIWDSRETRKFPRGVRTILEVKDYRGQTETFELFNAIQGG